MKAILSGGVVLLGAIPVGVLLFAQANLEKPPKMPNVNVAVQHVNQVPEVKSDWGTLRWLMNSQIEHDSAQTFGVVEIYPGQHNPLHSHPNCEEILYVLSGSCEHVIGNKRVTLHPGDLIRVPVGVPHQAFVTGKEPLRAVISYSSGDRKVVNYGETKE
jgi:mannose-6-phosphate isomerase-like protein (cupin superfamily)